MAHAFTGRPGGVSRGPYASLNLGLHVGDDPEAVRENRRRALEAAGTERAWLTLGQQVHGDRVLRVGRAERGAGASDAGTALPATDGLVTREPGVVLGVLVADCIPLLLADPEAGVVAAAHAGWRGTLDGIAERAVEVMVEAGARPSRILAAMGPSIGLCCYRVSEDLAERFVNAFGDSVVRPAPEGPHLDLRLANRSRLLAAGVPEANLSWQPACTACENHRLFSHRAQGGQAGRQGGFIWLPE
ncbi:multicopper polyphenol oxidase [Limnochorda pilosa]|uniref:Purine nucleoside phosphorylase n=1 Tax=Limnochorda pilosa TaxID=1555112 RepID=A0A0K2SKS9_LIMPI|nr:multicopper polyphenol oxidase [Limnochorda pilosa]